MEARSPGRWLAPLALLGVVLALFLILGGGGGDAGSEGDGGAAATTSTSTEERRTGGGEARRERRRTSVRVRPGDSLALIAERVGVDVETLQELNPDLDPQALTPGQRLTVRR